MNEYNRPRFSSANTFLIVALIGLCALIFWYSGGAPDVVDGKTQVTYWSGWAGEELQMVERFAEQFNEKHPDVDVKTTSIANSYQKMKVAFAGNDTPDICSTVWTHELADYAMRGALTPLDDYIAKSDRKPSDYYSAVWETYKYDGKTYALSQTMFTSFIAYNKKLFREAGFDPERPPRTLEEFDLMAEKLTKYRNDDPNQELLSLGYPYGASDALQWAVSFGVDFWDPVEHRVNVDSPEMVECFKWLKKNSDKYGAPRLRAFQSAFGNITSPNNPFISGKVAMMQVGDWYRCIMEEYAPEGFEWGWFPFPAPPNGRPDSTFLMASMFVIPQASKHKDEAWEFIEWMTSAHVSSHMHVGESPGGLPAIRSAAQQPDFQIPYWQFVAELLESPNAVPPPKFPLFERFSNELSRMVDYVVSNEISPEQAARQLQIEFQAEVDAAYRTVENRNSTATSGLPVEKQ